MKKDNGVKSIATKKGKNILAKGKANSERKNVSFEPEEYEEDRSMNIRMKPQPFKLSAKPDNNKKQK